MTDSEIAKDLFRSFPRKREPSGNGRDLWIPAFAGTSGETNLKTSSFWRSFGSRPGMTDE